MLVKRLESEAALHQRDQRFQMVARAANFVIWDRDLESDYIEWNEGIRTLCRYNRSEVRNDSAWWAEKIHPEDQERIFLSFQEALDSGETTWSGEYLFQCADGFFIMVEDRAYIVRDAEGRAIRAVGAMMDITQRKQDEATIRKLAAFPRFNPNPVLEFAADGTLTYFNDATETLTAALGGKHPIEIIPSDTTAIIRHCLESGRNLLRRETQIRGRILSWSFYPIPALRCVHCYAGDITEKVNLEAHLRQSQKLESIGRLSAGVAHDFNNVLTVIRGYSSMLLAMQAPDSKLREPLEQIAAATERATGLTRQLLMFSRKQAVQRSSINLNEVVDNLAKMLQRVVGRDIELQLQLAPHRLPVFADAGMLDQVLMNLVINARDAMPNGGRITVTTEPMEIPANAVPSIVGARAGSFVRLSVADTGTGIPPEIREKIFEPFFTTKEVGKGTGLGLAMVQSIVHQHEGWIELESTKDVGTTFHLFIPIHSATAPRPNQINSLSSLRGGDETILLVEDEPATRALARTILQRYGYHVLEASNATEALALWTEHRDTIRLVLLDFVLPEGRSGPELAQQLIADQPGLRLLFTSSRDIDPHSHGIDLPQSTGLLPKPFQTEALVALVRDALDRKPSHVSPTRAQTAPAPARSDTNQSR
jgi:PAS domain S-box-containing protein